MIGLKSMTVILNPVNTSRRFACPKKNYKNGIVGYLKRFALSLVGNNPQPPLIWFKSANPHQTKEGIENIKWEAFYNSQKLTCYFSLQYTFTIQQTSRENAQNYLVDRSHDLTPNSCNYMYCNFWPFTCKADYLHRPIIAYGKKKVNRLPALVDNPHVMLFNFLVAKTWH